VVVPLAFSYRITSQAGGLESFNLNSQVLIRGADTLSLVFTRTGLRNTTVE
jgi:hypothetical protein